MYEELISKRLYNRQSEKWGEYKVIELLGERGKSKVPYFRVKFKNTGNEIEAPLNTIKANKVIDMEAKKKATKKNNRGKKKEKKAKKEWVTKYLHNPKNIISLDLATISTGVCVSQNGKIVYNNYIYHEKDKDDPNNLVRRLNYMKNEVIKIMEEYNIDSVVVESTIFKGAKNVLFALSQIRGLILDYCFENGLEWISVSPMGWENYAWKGRFKNLETKERSWMSAKSDYRIDFKKKFAGETKEEEKKKVWEDCCDAFLLMKYVLNKRIINE